MVTVILLLLSEQIAALFSLDPLVLRMAFATAYLLLYFLTLLNFMYYFEYYKMAAAIGFALVLLNGAMTYLTVVFELPAGLGIGVSLLILVPLGYFFLKRGAKRIGSVDI
jgi:uncharacterized membrane protein